MKIKFLTISLLFTIIISSKITAQNNVILGEKVKLNSEILNDTREIWVSLPSSYNDTIYAPKKYPVCYFFDGDTHFKNFSAINDWLTRNVYASTPEIIMVGILQKDRSNELTPSHMKTPENWKRANFSTSGGNKNFMSFIEKELKPFINNNYRTTNYSILSGHSFGGLATVNCFVNTPQYFNAYIAIDPSMWWNNENILKNMSDSWVTKAHQNKRIFIAKATDPGSGEAHHKAILKLFDKLNAIPEPANFSFNYKIYDGEDHGSVVIPAEYDGLRYIFKDYQLPVKAAMKNPDLIDNHISKISKQLGYKVIPDEKIIHQLALVCKKQGLIKQYKALLQKNTKYHTNSNHAQEAYKDAVENNY
ncbi:alpha/beta hydrolase [Seonamhaeicola sp.]|uniref:alpha/beta hydrolase n=1 Tax=Seonamhaeicola sp. TaxID=1912245 RepID=UPI00356A3199